MGLLAKLQNVDRRILYVLTALVISVPLLMKPARHPHVIFAEVRNAYKTIDSVPDDKIVLVSTIWGAGTAAENGPQTEALMRHMFTKGIKFVVLSWDPTGTELSYQIGAKLEKELGKEYGVDWAHLGYRVPQLLQVISGLSEDFQKQLKQDRFNTPLDRMPVTRNVKNYKQIGTLVEITPSGTLEVWIAYLTMPKKIPLVFCPTAVMAAEAYPYIDSGQVRGMLNGVIGAAQYETLIGQENERTYAAAAAWALSAAHIFIILLVVLGNLGYLAAKRMAEREGRATRGG